MQAKAREVFAQSGYYCLYSAAFVQYGIFRSRVLCQDAYIARAWEDALGGLMHIARASFSI